MSDDDSDQITIIVAMPLTKEQILDIIRAGRDKTNIDIQLETPVMEEVFSDGAQVIALTIQSSVHELRIAYGHETECNVPGGEA